MIDTVKAEQQRWLGALHSLDDLVKGDRIEALNRLRSTAARSRAMERAIGIEGAIAAGRVEVCAVSLLEHDDGTAKSGNGGAKHEDWRFEFLAFDAPVTRRAPRQHRGFGISGIGWEVLGCAVDRRVDATNRRVARHAVDGGGAQRLHLIADSCRGMQRLVRRDVASRCEAARQVAVAIACGRRDRVSCLRHEASASDDNGDGWQHLRRNGQAAALGLTAIATTATTAMTATVTAIATIATRSRLDTLDHQVRDLEALLLLHRRRIDACRDAQRATDNRRLSWQRELEPVWQAHDRGKLEARPWREDVVDPLERHRETAFAILSRLVGRALERVLWQLTCAQHPFGRAAAVTAAATAARDARGLVVLLGDVVSKLDSGGHQAVVLGLCTRRERRHVRCLDDAAGGGRYARGHAWARTIVVIAALRLALVLHGARSGGQDLGAVCVVLHVRNE
mmetsp:Transcript_57713/g.114596  ORF Transcript_57713/g.114596 Transcript_57713/m.114596 type:complete len:452 (+) Transcript_57713:481-1836(+)